MSRHSEYPKYGGLEKNFEGKQKSADWNSTAKILPPDGEVVKAMDSSGHIQELKRQGNLWWFADGSMYVYFTPQFWQSKREQQS